MKILSRFHDYYDGLAKSYIDDELTYRRDFNLESEPTTSITKLSKEFNSLVDIFSTKFGVPTRSRAFTRVDFIVFCSKVYSIYSNRNSPKSGKVLYKVDSGQKYILGRDPVYYFYLEPFEDSTNLNEKYKTPIVSLHRSKGKFYRTLNPQLSLLDFPKFLTPFEIYQELSYYLGNILLEKEKILVPSNEEKIEMHGFDKKVSFRKCK